VSRYLTILARQRPFDFNQDESGRVMFSCNYDARAAAPVEQWGEEITAVLIASGSCVALGTDVFIGRAAKMPVGEGPYVTVLPTGGANGRPSTHNLDLYEDLSVQIVVRATKYRTARTRALAIWRALDGIRNTTLVA
jgi:hypothetical protein